MIRSGFTLRFQLCCCSCSHLDGDDGLKLLILDPHSFGSSLSVKLCVSHHGSNYVTHTRHLAFSKDGLILYNVSSSVAAWDVFGEQTTDNAGQTLCCWCIYRAETHTLRLDRTGDCACVCTGVTLTGCLRALCCWWSAPCRARSHTAGCRHSKSPPLLPASERTGASRDGPPRHPGSAPQVLPGAHDVNTFWYYICQHNLFNTSQPIWPSLGHKFHNPIFFVQQIFLQYCSIFSNR